MTTRNSFDVLCGSDTDIDSNMEDKKCFNYSREYKFHSLPTSKTALLKYDRTIWESVLLIQFLTDIEAVKAAQNFFDVGPHKNIVPFHDCNPNHSHILVGCSTFVSLPEFLQKSALLFWEQEVGGKYEKWVFSPYAVDFLKGIFAGVNHIIKKKKLLDIDENSILVDGDLSHPFPMINVSLAIPIGNNNGALMFQNITKATDYLMKMSQISIGHPKQPSEEVIDFIDNLRIVSNPKLPLMLKFHPAILTKKARLLYLVRLRECMIQGKILERFVDDTTFDYSDWRSTVRKYDHLRGIYNYEKNYEDTPYMLISFIRNFKEHINEYIKQNIGPSNPWDLPAPIPLSSNASYSILDIQTIFQKLFPSLLLWVHNRITEKDLVQLEGVDEVGIQP